MFDLQIDGIEDIVSDKQSGIPVLTGADNMFYPEYGPTDPYAVEDRGYYFHSQSYMSLPPHISESNYLLTIGAEFTVSMWIRAKDSTGVLFEKQTETSTTIISYQLESYVPKILIRLYDLSSYTEAEHYASTGISEAFWYNIGFSINLDLANEVSQITCYLDGNP